MNFNKQMFQHRHYASIARCIANTANREGLISELTDLFARDNAKFDLGRFESACIGAPSNWRDDHDSHRTYVK